ncbi:MAG: D-alanyl-D-alanine carboxypeptidase/D-alanyl-D-alanine-endopeptidase [Muribaculaceae bacterium]
MSKIRHRIIAILVAMACSVALWAGDTILNIPREEATTIGIYVKDLRTGEVVVDHNSQLAMTPASVTKLFTSAAVMIHSGIEAQFATRVYLSGRPNASDRSRWDGDLVIASVGDPSLEHGEFPDKLGFCDSIIAKLSAMGITGISGRILIEESLSDAGPIGTWECEDIPWPYGAGLFGFNYGENYVKVYPNKGVTEPESTLKINVVTSRGTTDLRRGFDSDRLTVVIPRRKRRQADFSMNTTLNDPAAMFRMLLTKRLGEAGISVGGKTVDGGNKCELYTHFSPTFGEILYVTNKVSDNLLAEGMLRTLAPDSCREVCLQAELAMLDSVGISTDCLDLLDGSGLTRATLAPPIAAANLLEAMLYTEYADLFIDMLPIAGVDGTLKTFGEGTALQGRAAMKTGSMRNVQNMAGYLLDSEGMPTHVVAVFVNGFLCKRADLRTAIANYLVQFIETE